jgi:hypothetical protein
MWPTISVPSSAQQMKNCATIAGICNPEGRGYEPCSPEDTGYEPTGKMHQVLDLYWRSPKSSDVWYTSRHLKEMEICNPEGTGYD